MRPGCVADSMQASSHVVGTEEVGMMVCMSPAWITVRQSVVPVSPRHWAREAMRDLSLLARVGRMMGVGMGLGPSITMMGGGGDC